MFKKNKKALLGNGSDWPTKSLEGKDLKAHQKERARYGFSHWDWWSFDTYITWVIANACIDFRDNGHGYVYGNSEEEQSDFLNSIIEPLLEYSENKFDVTLKEEETLYNNAKEAMVKFSEHLGHFWD